MFGKLREGRPRGGEQDRARTFRKDIRGATSRTEKGGLQGSDASEKQDWTTNEAYNRNEKGSVNFEKQRERVDRDENGGGGGQTTAISTSSPIST